MLETGNLTLQVDLALRLVVAAVLGAVVGFEREIHDHPAGMRTHLLVSLGSALFTVLSIYGFVGALGPAEQTAPDPTRIAAQIVTGIGFLGAGAIIKYGTSIRGLTTAGSLWATAAIGMAAGAGQIIVAVVGTAIVVFSLWPLNRIVDRLRVSRTERSAFGSSSAAWTESARSPPSSPRTGSRSPRSRPTERQEPVRGGARSSSTAATMRPEALLELITSIPDVDVLESSSLGE